MTPNPLEPVLFEVKRTIVGQDVLLERMAVAMLAGGHLLVEGVPGLAKTLAVKSLAGAIGGEFQRIQFTPDLVPADLVGTRVYHQRSGEFEVAFGPVFTNLLLADEINRAPAKVQSALLEVMQERQVTIGRETYDVPEPFLVMATQNPIESDGTYPLPEAQVDRFMMKVVVGYPTPPEEHAIVERALVPAGPPQVMLTPEDLIRMRGSVEQVYVDPAITDYAVRLVAATRSPGTVGLGDLDRYVTYGAESPGHHRPRPRRSSTGLLARPRLRASVRHRRAGPRRVAAPDRALVRGAGRRPRRGQHPHPRAAGRAGSRSRPAAVMSGTERLLHRLEWRIVRRLDGRIQGGYRTPRRGSGLDFAGLRPYVEGDDARHIDWNVTARLDEPQVREFNEDRELTSWLVLDRSASMVVGGPGRGKQDVSAELALVLARLLGRNGNRVGAVLYDTGTARVVPPGTGRTHALRIGRELDRPVESRAAATTDLADMLEAVASLARRSLVVVISDFIGTGDWQRPLGRLAFRNEVVALRVVDEADDALPEVGLIVVEDAETGEQVLVDSADPWFRARFDDGVGEREADLAAGMRRAGVPLHRVNTGSDLVETLVRVITQTRPGPSTSSGNVGGGSGNLGGGSGNVGAGSGNGRSRLGRR